ncbi:MAG: hypothetical protein AAGA55_05950 [Planctomycetota bacterium]
MSRKWQQNKAWEDEHLVGVLTPIRWVLRAFSTIPLAVVLLVFISVYSTLASVPIGLIALIPTWAVYAMTAALSGLIPAVLLIMIVRSMVPGQVRGTRFTMSLLGGLGIGIAGVGAWHRFAWPVMHYDPATGSGIEFFSDFVETYKAVTLRRLPVMEMTETQFYAWWPMKLALWLFVMNMIVTTVRRIEFNFRNIGVLSVHTGIVLIAVGSVFYQRFKEEGDTLLRAAPSTDAVGPPQRSFYDREDVVLYIAQHRDVIGSLRYQQRRLDVPRYNNYNLKAGVGDGALFSERPSAGGNEGTMSPADRAAMTDGGRVLDRPVPMPQTPDGQTQFLDPDINFRVVGYASYAELRPDWIDTQPGLGQAAAPMRVVELFANIPGADLPTDTPIFEFPFFLRDPSQRVRTNDIVAIEFTKEMDEDRWTALSSSVPLAARHALVIEVPGVSGQEPFRVVLPAAGGERIELGETGWRLHIREFAEEPPFPIITEGYQGATSSLAIVELTPPPAPDGTQAETIERWIYHRFPEINQDLGTSPDPLTGRPSRGAPDPRVRVSYLDMTRLQVYLDERADGSVRAIVRQPGGAVEVTERIEGEWIRNIVPNDEGAAVDLRLGERWQHAEKIELPAPTPVQDRDISMVGSHTFAFVAVEVSLADTSPFGPWSETIWLPFTKYMEVEAEKIRTLRVPGGGPEGREIKIAFGRMQRPLPGFSVSLADFEMISYDHRGAPRDYQSVVRVAPTVRSDDPAGNFPPYEHLIKLNAPLRAPFHWDPQGNILSNLARRLAAGMNPDQFKFSQAGWDRAGWNQTQELVDRGELPEPRVNFTILGVGNNPGIHVVAFGGILMGAGIPWAFYVKPWMVRREKQRLAALAKSGKIKPASRSRSSSTQPAPEPSA